MYNSRIQFFVYFIYRYYRVPVPQVEAHADPFPRILLLCGRQETDLKMRLAQVGGEQPHLRHHESSLIDVTRWDISGVRRLNNLHVMQNSLL